MYHFNTFIVTRWVNKKLLLQVDTTNLSWLTIRA